MKKTVLIAVVTVMALFKLAYADGTNFKSTEELLNRSFNNDGETMGSASLRVAPTNNKGTCALHRQIGNPDPFVISSDAGVNCAGYKYAMVDISLAGTTPNFTLIPLFYNSTAVKYFEGTKFNSISSERFIIEVNGTPSFFVRCETMSGTTPIAQVYVTPMN